MPNPPAYQRLFAELKRRHAVSRPVVIGLALALLTTTLVACFPSQVDTAPPPNTETEGAPVWAIDLVRTLPGAQLDYVRSIETNWAGARTIARERGAVLSYGAFVAPPDTARGWDVLLMTEYADSAAYANREETFQEIFASPEFVAVEPARPSAEMREFMSGNVVLREFVSSNGR